MFGRYDCVDPDQGRVKAQPKFKNDYYNVGIEWTPVKIVDLSLVYKHDGGKDGSIGDATARSAAAPPSRAGIYNEMGLFGQFRW